MLLKDCVKFKVRMHWKCQFNTWTRVVLCIATCCSSGGEARKHHSPRIPHLCLVTHDRKWHVWKLMREAQKPEQETRGSFRGHCLVRRPRLLSPLQGSLFPTPTVHSTSQKAGNKCVPQILYKVLTSENIAIELRMKSVIRAYFKDTSGFTLAARRRALVIQCLKRQHAK